MYSSRFRAGEKKPIIHAYIPAWSWTNAHVIRSPSTVRVLLPRLTSVLVTNNWIFRAGVRLAYTLSRIAGLKCTPWMIAYSRLLTTPRKINYQLPTPHCFNKLRLLSNRPPQRHSQSKTRPATLHIAGRKIRFRVQLKKTGFVLAYAATGKGARGAGPLEQIFCCGVRPWHGYRCDPPTDIPRLVH